MDVDVVGRVRHARLGKSKGMHALFEAVINSIHSIEDRGAEGRIDITIQRSDQEELIEGSTRNISGFEIEDNGIGFNSENYESFNTSDSRYKEDRGGQGVGRFLWLKVFKRAEIESIYSDDGTKKKRYFTFELAPDGITGHSIEEDIDQEISTSVVLSGIRDRYADGIPVRQKTVALRLVEHCLEYFVLGRNPRMYLHDEDRQEIIDLEDVYSELVEESDKVTYEVNDQEFHLRHFMLDVSGGYDHKVNFCATMRVVDGISLKNKLPDLKDKLPDEEGNDRLIYRGYVSGEYLDENVNEQRTGFYTAEDQDLFAGEITLESIEDKAVSEASKYLEEYIGPVREEKKERIRKYVNEDAPQFRHVLKHKEEKIDDIPPESSDEEIDNELYNLSKELEKESRKRGKEILDGTEGEDEEDIKEKYNRYIDEVNDIAKSNLAKYIIHRGRTLEILSSRLEKYPSEDYELEEAIHKTIFPLKSTSDEVSYEQQNLWILDEKLAFHYYLASDKTFTSMETVESDSQKRPDLLIFDNPIAVTNDDRPATGVTIFEFKRPMRDNYQREENPIHQVIDYVEKIRNEEVTDRAGRPMPVNENTPFMCYIVADITSSLRSVAKDFQLHETPDSEGYIGYNAPRNAYIEIVSFGKLIRDAKRRNSILFEKLHLPVDF